LLVPPWWVGVADEDVDRAPPFHGLVAGGGLLPGELAIRPDSTAAGPRLGCPVSTPSIGVSHAGC